MKTVELQVIETPKELMALPVGSRILAHHLKVFELDQIETVTKRPDAGNRYWIEPGTLQPYPLDGLDHWFPAYVLPNRS